ncbi:MAG: choice-of-anchor L domain-containing protein, partial [Myxococcales bacterium]|nr:choice-of-anchor L domain-containing protein [Myxococcales bacterium]
KLNCPCGGGTGGSGGTAGTGGTTGGGGSGGFGNFGGFGGFGGSGGAGGFGGSGGDGGQGGIGPCPDLDNDGYGTCEGDCNDSNPLVNPGAFDFPGNGDDDCDGPPDNEVAVCDNGLAYTSQDPFEYAQAIDICQTTTAGAMGANKIWGLIDAQFRLATGTATPAPQSHAIVQSLGNVLAPRKGTRFVFMSSGLAGAPGQPYFQPGTPQGGTAFGNSTVAPAGFPSNKAGCPLPGTSIANDSVNLRLEIRTPTNAFSLAFDNGFFSAEYPEYACSTFNDLWVVLLTTGASGLPNNKNVVFDSQGTPGSVNLNFFDRCLAGATGCFGTPGFNFCAGGTGELAGTGYGATDNGNPCGAPTTIGGSTGWITSQAPIVPGEVITIEFIVWDSTDPIFDSSSMIDNFRWQKGSLPGPNTFRP